MSDVTFVAALPPDALATVQAPPPGTPNVGGLEGLRPAERGAVLRRPETGADPFAALLQGFWASTQPPAPAQPLPAGAAEGTEAAMAEVSPPISGLPAAPPLPIQPGTTPPAAAADDPAAGTILPLTGSGLPVEPPGLPTGETDGAAPDPLLPEAPPPNPGSKPERVSLADLEAGRQLRLVSTGNRADDFRTALPAVAPDGDPPAMPDSGTDASTPPADGDQTRLPLRTQPTTPPDFSRLVVELSAAPARELPAVNQGRPELRLADGVLNTTTHTTTTGDPGLRGLVGNALQGFPALQPLGEPKAWSEGLGDRLLTLAGPGTHSARLKLHPENLGALDVEISIDDGSAQVWFGTSHHQAREAIESSLPRLREMFADQGLNLIRAQVDSGAERRTPYGPAGQPDPDLAGSTSGWSRRPDASFSPATASNAQGSRLLDVWA